MKFEPLTEPEKRNMMTQKKFNEDVKLFFYVIFSWFMADLEHSESRVPDAWSIVLKISSLKTFYLKEIGSRTKKSLAQLSYYWFSQGTIFAKKCWLFAK